MSKISEMSEMSKMTTKTTTKKNELTQEGLLKIITPYVNSLSVNDGDAIITIEIDKKHIVKEPYAWHVRVIPSSQPSRDWRLLEEVAILIEDIAEKEGVRVYLIPSATPANKSNKPIATIAA
jgi:hypothetical protein